MVRLLRSRRLRALRLSFAALAFVLLSAQTLMAGTDAWCPVPVEETQEDHDATAMAHHAGMDHGVHESEATDSESHHSDDSACPMMALCTLSVPTPATGLPPTLGVTLESPDVSTWSVHGVLLSHTSPPPRV